MFHHVRDENGRLVGKIAAGVLPGLITNARNSGLGLEVSPDGARYLVKKDGFAFGDPDVAQVFLWIGYTIDCAAKK